MEKTPMNLKICKKIFDELREYVMLRQEEFCAEHSQDLPCLIFLEDKPWQVFTFGGVLWLRPWGQNQENTKDGWKSYIGFESEIKEKLIKSMQEDCDYFKLWTITRAEVENKLEWLEEQMRIAREYAQKYQDNIENNEVYQNFLALKIAEKLKNSDKEGVNEDEDKKKKN